MWGLHKLINFPYNNLDKIILSYQFLVCLVVINIKLVWKITSWSPAIAIGKRLKLLDVRINHLNQIRGSNGPDIDSENKKKLIIIIILSLV
jgi:hypothetical protein